VPATRSRKPAAPKNAPAAAAPAADAPRPSAPPAGTQGGADDRETLIRTAAYALYERRGGVSGHELEDWLQAEIEVDRLLGGAPETGPA
jgi:hypothetical protein